MSLLPQSVQEKLRAGAMDEIPLVCLTISHPNLSPSIRLVNDRADLARSAGTFNAFPFTFKLGNRSDSEIPFGEIIADNVSEDIITGIRGLASVRPKILYECVFVSEPDDVVQGPLEFVLVGASAPMATVTLQIALDYEFLNSAFPKDIFSPTNRG